MKAAPPVRAGGRFLFRRARRFSRRGANRWAGKQRPPWQLNTPVNATNEKSEKISFVMTPSLRETVHKNRSSEPANHTRFERADVALVTSGTRISRPPVQAGG
jgi:hypothetical protein